ncbi:MAG: glycerophosphodiester phosphodiesterase [Spirochaetales bacterium]|nr:glycerophosphodiester phosphodiesterase [Spirochaetales bacterium]
MARRNDAPILLTCLCSVLWILTITGSLWAGPGPDCDIQAHRGGRALRPENTLAAFAHAVELGADTLEMDLAVTRDRVVVVSHDYRLNPLLTRGPDGRFIPEDARILIKDLDFEQLQLYTVGEIRRGSDYWYRFRDQVPVPGQTIPSLDQVFALTASEEAEAVRFNLEIKTYPPFPDYTVDYGEFVELVLEVIRRHGMESRVTMQSFDWRTLREVKKQAPGIPVVCLAVESFSIDGARYNLLPGGAGSSPWLAGLDSDDYAGIADLAHAFGAEVLSPYYREIDRRDVDEAHRLGLKIIPWTVNDPGIMKKLIGWGVDGIITDSPDLLMQVVEELASD